MQKQWKNNCFY